MNNTLTLDRPWIGTPVTLGPDRYELIVRFLVDAFPEAHGGLVYEGELEALPLGEQRLRRTAAGARSTRNESVLP